MTTHEQIRAREAEMSGAVKLGRVLRGETAVVDGAELATWPPVGGLELDESDTPGLWLAHVETWITQRLRVVAECQ